MIVAAGAVAAVALMVFGGHDSPDKKRPAESSSSGSPSLTLPTKLPSSLPTELPTALPSNLPSELPSEVPSDIGSLLPSLFG
ncbi:hypothetical protein R6V09_33770 [Streptomyces sp. W16]|uniref:hypothetical protein n=1 Tax=Streptomyces sp. W16 TaxID=3076631 RepID=UPI00295B5FAD|nr:hypothetical protein [Streptomyces sp. W16]MDV9175068.1 hypothetical protein [Streptomyces sp. W16]